MKKNKIFSKTIYSQKSVERTDNKVKKLGISNNIDTITFMNIRIITTIVLFIIILLMSRYGYFIAPIVSFIYYFLYEKVLLDDRLKQRAIKLENEATYFFEVLTLSLETGRNLEQALNVSIKNIDSELSNEFKNAIREVKFGKSLTESLIDMQRNIPSDSINNILLTLTQADLYGNSIINTMYNQIDYLREKEIMEKKAIISKIPIKVSVISVFFFIPLILLIILGPVLLNFIGV